MKSLIFRLLVLALSIGVNTANAQQFKWVTGGGSIDAISSGTVSTQFMCTDNNGNIYALTNVSNISITADTFTYTTAYGNPNLLVTSYNCSGQMRWAKLVYSANGAGADGIAYDSLHGYIYVAGTFLHVAGPLHVGYDTTIPSPSYMAKGLIQLDTVGHFNWIRFVGNNTIASYGALEGLGHPLAVDGANNAHYLCYMKSGVVLMPGDTSHYGVYDLSYNTSGSLLSAVRLDLDSQWYLTGAVIDPSTNKLYVCGDHNNSFGAGTDTTFAAAFDASRNQLWLHIAGHGTNDNGIGSVSIDSIKNLRFTGGTNGVAYFYFNGDSVMRTYSTYNMSVIMTTDTNGNPTKFKHFDGNTSVNNLVGHTIVNNKIAAIGTFAGLVKDGITTLNTASGIWLPYMPVIDTAGSTLQLQEIHADAGHNQGTSITSDKIGNIYIGGSVADSIWANNGATSIPAYHSIGGTTGFFIMKFGYDCNCTTAPTASYTDTGIHLTKTFVFSGSASNIDSIVWSFGDGLTDTGMSIAHTYADTGTYHVCVTVYSGCGNDSFCSNVLVYYPVSTPPFSVENIRVYPNPVKDQLTVSGILQPTSYTIENAIGVVLQKGTLNKSGALSLQNYPSGLYMLNLIDQKGEHIVFKITKE